MNATDPICYTKIDDNIFKLLESKGFKHELTIVN